MNLWILAMWTYQLCERKQLKVMNHGLLDVVKEVILTQ